MTAAGKHTPEDWVAGSVMVDGRVPDDEAIVYVGGDADTGPEVEIIIRGPGAARISGMIAAAPTMLAALKAIRAHRPDHADNAWDAVDEAIAKAVAS